MKENKKKISLANKIKLGVVAMCGLLATGLVGFGVYAAANETVVATNAGSVEFKAGGFVDAKVEAFINSESIGSVEFTAENMTVADQARTLEIRSLKESDWLDNTATTDNTADKYVEFKFEITNVKNADKDDYDLLIATVDPTAPENATLTVTKPVAKLAVEEKTTYIYRYDVTGLKDVDFTIQNFVMNLTADKTIAPYHA